MPYRRDPRMSGRHPFEIFMLALGALTGIPTLFGVAPEPGSIDASLPGWAVFAWSLVLTVGSVVALVGVAWKERGLGLILEQLGLALVGVVALIYAGAVVTTVGSAGIFPAGILFGFGAACLARWRDLQEVINEAQRAVGDSS